MAKIQQSLTFEIIGEVISPALRFDIIGQCISDALQYDTTAENGIYSEARSLVHIISHLLEFQIIAEYTICINPLVPEFFKIILIHF